MKLLFRLLRIGAKTIKVLGLFAMIRSLGLQGTADTLASAASFLNRFNGRGPRL